MKIARVIVAVPARNEATTVQGCVASIDRAASAAGVPTTIVVAADSCEDATADLVLNARPTLICDLIVLRGAWARAGGARAAAVAAGLACISRRHERAWIANTDADCVVPTDWMSTQLALAERCDAVAGIVDLDPSLTPGALLRRFKRTYRLDGDRHTHVHGANLGVNAAAYQAVGGWCPHTIVGEDHGLWNRLGAAGFRRIQTTHVAVTTSSRTQSRVEGGFATDLRALAELDVASSPSPDVSAGAEMGAVA